jgi:hypothetical protein
MDGGAGRDHHEDKDGEMNPFWGFPAPEEHRRGPTSRGVASCAASWRGGSRRWRGGLEEVL